MRTLPQSLRSKLQADHWHASAPLAARTTNRQGHGAPAQIRKFDHRHRARLWLRGSEPFHQDVRGERRDESRGVAARAEGLKKRSRPRARIGKSATACDFAYGSCAVGFPI